MRSSSTAASGKKQAAKSKEELAQEKKKELEKRLQDVSGQLNNNKKPAKKGKVCGFTVLPVPGKLWCASLRQSSCLLVAVDLSVVDVISVGTQRAAAVWGLL